MSITTDITQLNSQLSTWFITTDIGDLSLTFVSGQPIDDRFSITSITVDGNEVTIVFVDGAETPADNWAVKVYSDSEGTNLVSRRVTEGLSVVFTGLSSGDYWFTITPEDVEEPAPEPEPVDDTEAGDIAWANAFYDATGGDNWTNNTGWNGGALASLPVGDIADAPFGLRVETIGGENRIVAVKFNGTTVLPSWYINDTDHNADSFAPGESGGNNLVGTIDTLPWRNLGECKYINLKQNKSTAFPDGDPFASAPQYLVGSVPQSLFEMRSLQWLALSGQWGEIDIADRQWNENVHTGNPTYGTKAWGMGNRFTGDLPEVTSPAQNLALIEIRGSNITGALPDSWGNLPALEGLFLNNQKGTVQALGGGIPANYGNLSKLKHLHLSGNLNFTGTIPEGALSLPELRHVRFWGCKFTGEYPRFATTDMRVIEAHENNFTGGFPIEYFQGNNPLLSLFGCANNQLTDPIPDTMVPATLDGEPWPYKSMSKFGISQNNYGGSIPSWFWEMTGNQVFTLNDCGFTGGFPAEIMALTNVKAISLNNNPLGGSLPNQEWLSTRGIINLSLSGCGFTGEIPSLWNSLVNHPLQYFYMENNDLTGVIPAWFGDLSGSTGTPLQRFKFGNNRFTYSHILPNYNYIKTNNSAFEIAPQKPFTENDTVLFREGDTFSKNYAAYDYTNNQYQWFKNGVAIPGETNFDINIGTLTADNDGDSYYLRITNPDLPVLTESLSGTTTLTFDTEVTQ